MIRFRARGRYLRLVGPADRPLFSERNGHVGRVPLAFGWRILIRKDARG